MDRSPISPSLYRWFLFIALAQFILLMVLTQVGPGRSARRAATYEGSERVTCADQREEVRVPLNFPMTSLHCEGEACRHSRYVQVDESPLEMETHIIAVESGRGPAAKGPQWPRINVSLEPTTLPVRLVLSSRRSVQWDLRGVQESTVREVHVVTPQAARITGLSDRPDIGLFWHGEETLCVHPYSWWDVDNPNNEYQRFISALRRLFSTQEVSFQGTRWGESFKVPFYESRQDEVEHVLNFRKKWQSQQRSLASVGGETLDGPIYDLHNHALRDKGWGQVDVSTGALRVLQEIPEGRTFLDRSTDGETFLLTDGARLLLYNLQLKEETSIPAPVALGDFSRLHLARFQSGGPKVTAYFRDFGGVVQEWDPESREWTRKFDFYRQEIEQWLWGEKSFWGVALHKNIIRLLKYDTSGRKIDQREYLLPREHGGSRTRWILDRRGKGFLLRHYSAASPEGHWYYLGASGEVQILSRL